MLSKSDREDRLGGGNNWAADTKENGSRPLSRAPAVTAFKKSLLLITLQLQNLYISELLNLRNGVLMEPVAVIPSKYAIITATNLNHKQNLHTNLNGQEFFPYRKIFLRVMAQLFDIWYAPASL